MDLILTDWDLNDMAETELREAGINIKKVKN